MLFYGDNLALMREYIPDESVDLVYLRPRWHGCGPEDVKVQDTGYLTSFSINGEYTCDALWEPREWLLRASVTPSNVKVLQEPHRRFSPLICDLPPALASTVAAL
jgi:hypothetical protein